MALVEAAKCVKIAIAYSPKDFAAHGIMDFCRTRLVEFKRRCPFVEIEIRVAQEYQPHSEKPRCALVGFYLNGEHKTIKANRFSADDVENRMWSLVQNMSRERPSYRMTPYFHEANFSISGYYNEHIFHHDGLLPASEAEQRLHADVRHVTTFQEADELWKEEASSKRHAQRASLQAKRRAAAYTLAAQQRSTAPPPTTEEKAVEYAKNVDGWVSGAYVSTLEPAWSGAVGDWFGIVEPLLKGDEVYGFSRPGGPPEGGGEGGAAGGAAAAGAGGAAGGGAAAGGAASGSGEATSTAAATAGGGDGAVGSAAAASSGGAGDGAKEGGGAEPAGGAAASGEGAAGAGAAGGGGGDGKSGGGSSSPGPAV